jgi:hypothetical protein
LGVAAAFGAERGGLDEALLEENLLPGAELRREDAEYRASDGSGECGGRFKYVRQAGQHQREVGDG